MQILYFIQQSIIWVITIYYIYELLISVFSFVKLKDKPLNPQQMAFVQALISTLPYDTEAAYVKVYGAKGDRILHQKYASQILRSPRVQEYKRQREKEILEDIKILKTSQFMDDECKEIETIIKLEKEGLHE